MPFLSFIVGYRNREIERVKLFLESLNAINSDNYELIFVDYGSDEDVSESVKQIVANYPFANYHFFNSRGQNWNRAKCLNYGYRFCKGQYIFTSDIDFLYDVDFMSIIKEIAISTKAFYFQVGFLSQKQSKNIHSDTKKYDIESYSNEDAIGALLISKKMFDEVGGYDEFYEIWGVEDNDLLYRIKMTNNQISFYNSKTIIWHIWHLPIKQSAILPNGWVKFLKDYFEHKKQNISSCNQNYYCNIDKLRPTINRNDISYKSLNINCSEKYLGFLIKNELQKLDPNHGLALKFNFNEVDRVKGSRLNKLVQGLNKYFKKLKLPLFLANENMSQYIEQQTALETLQYFIKFNAELIADYYLPNDISENTVYIIKK